MRRGDPGGRAPATLDRVVYARDDDRGSTQIAGGNFIGDNFLAKTEPHAISSPSAEESLRPAGWQGNREWTP